MKKIILFGILSVIGIQLHGFSYINNKDIALRDSYLDCDCVVLQYNSLDSGDEYHSAGSKKRFLGMHNMQVRVPGYEPVYLIQDGVCEYPHLYTIIGAITPSSLKYNLITQRWACVKYFMPLYFGFEVKKEQLIVTSALSKYRFFAPCMAKQAIDLVKTEGYSDQDSSNNIEVHLNGRGVLLDGQVVAVVDIGWLLFWKMLFPINMLL